MSYQDNFKYEILKPTDCVKTFQCGDEDLDNFITKESADYTKSLLSVTYIVTNKSKNKVVAYFSLAADKLSVNDFASNREFNRFRKRRFVHEKRLRSYPAVKLCRLGVDISMKGTGLGSIIHGFTFDVIKTKPCHCLHKAKAKISSKRKEIFRFSFACFVYFVYFLFQIIPHFLCDSEIYYYFCNQNSQ